MNRDDPGMDTPTRRESEAKTAEMRDDAVQRMLRDKGVDYSEHEEAFPGRPTTRQSRAIYARIDESLASLEHAMAAGHRPDIDDPGKIDDAIVSRLRPLDWDGFTEYQRDREILRILERENPTAVTAELVRWELDHLKSKYWDEDHDPPRSTWHTLPEGAKLAAICGHTSVLKLGEAESRGIVAREVDLARVGHAERRRWLGPDSVGRSWRQSPGKGPEIG